MHVAGRICARLRELNPNDDETTRLVRLAALLHDIGHGPFSHVSEFVLDRNYDQDALGDLGQTAKIHERITADLLRNDGDIAAILSEDDREAIAGLLEGSPRRRLEHDIVSSSLDADKMDYLLRDSYFAGVQYGQFDLDKIIDVCRVLSRGGETYLAFDEEGIYALEQLVVAKYHMGQQVYYHRIRAITDAMLVRGLSIAVREGVEDMDRAFRYDGTDDFLGSYTALDDELVLNKLSNCDHPIVRDIFSRLRDRRLLKEIAAIAVGNVEDVIKRNDLSTLPYESERSRRLEGAIASEINFSPEMVIVTRQSIKNPTFRTPSYRLAEEEIMVLDPSATPKTVAEFPDLIFSLNTKAVSRETVRVFATKDEWNDPEDPRQEEREQLSQRIEELVLANVG
jgi:HD superfamily phosphohydrolase